DPLADKLLTIAALVSLVQMDMASAWIVAIIIGRELAVTTLRSIAYARGVPMPASPMGKLKMIGEVVAILALILAHGDLPLAEPLNWIGQVALWFVLATALTSAFDYFRRFIQVFTTPKVADLRVVRA